MRNKISRRAIIKKFTALLSLVLVQNRVIGRSRFDKPVGFQTKDIYHFKLGKFKCVCLRDTDVTYPFENFYKGVSKELVEQALSEIGAPTDLVHTPVTHLVVNTGKNKILVDTGWGKDLSKNMKVAGIDPSEIDTVFITHAHPDHIGGILNEHGEPVYSNAKYYIWKSEWDFWFSKDAETIAKESHIKAARTALLPIKDKTTFLESESALFPGVQVQFTPGHTPGHCIYSFTSEKETLYYTGDVVLSPIHLDHPDWLPTYDLIPDKAAESKTKVFNALAESNAMMIGQQFFPFPSVGRIKKKEVGWTFSPISV